MKKLLIGIIFIVLCSLGIQADAQAPKSIVGMGGECDPIAYSGCTVIPLSASIICDGDGAHLDCPQYFAPDWVDTTGLRFFGITNRANPPRCVKSVNGGAVWGLCDATTISPFSGAIDSSASLTVASDGSLVAAADQGANNCIFRRSTDYGVNWTTVYTDTTGTVSCGVGFGDPTPSLIRCASANPYCVVIGRTVSTFDLIAYYSIDNGVNWTKGTAFNIVSGDEQLSITVNAGGTLGSLSRFGMNYNSAGRKFAYTTGSDWTITNLVVTPPGEIDGGGSRCPGTLIFNNQQAVFCGPGTVATTTYRLYTHAAGSTAYVRGVIPESGLTNAQSPDFMTVGFNASAGYMVGRNVANTQIQVHVTMDSFNTVLLIASLTPATVLTAGCCRGDMYVWNGKMYFTSGASGSFAFFGKIQ